MIAARFDTNTVLVEANCKACDKLLKPGDCIHRAFKEKLGFVLCIPCAVGSYVEGRNSK